MKFLSFICGLVALSSSVAAHAIPDDASLIEHDSLEKRQGGFLPVTGTGGNVQPRLEIRQLARKPNQYSIFLLAMRQWQAQPQNQKASYYDVASVHGVPNRDFDGVSRCSDCTGVNVNGYCTHDSILFPAWHRMYVVLFEQELVKIAKNIANTFPARNRAVMQRAANNLRVPYWDWAARPPGNSNLPPALSASRVSVITQNGRQTIPNPLFRHDFDDPSQLKYAPYTRWQRTLRHPTSNADNAVSDTQGVINAFNNIRASLQDQVYQMFSTCTEYVEFSNDLRGGNQARCFNSLESVHNIIHNTAGGLRNAQQNIPAGTMTVLPEASFDPIFWLHHSNVDRLFALWQAVHPNSYSGSQVAPHYTWTIRQGSTQNLNSPLTPFHRDSSGSFWTSNQCRNWRQFGYTYPEFSNSDGSQQSIQRYINQLYGPNASRTAGSAKKRSAAPAPQEDVLDGIADQIKDDITPLLANNGSKYQYVANIETQRYALGGSYNIYIFNGAPESEDPSQWIYDENLIGPMGVTAGPDMGNVDALATSSVPLTRTLTGVFESGILGALEPLVVVPYLQSKLQWRVIGTEGESVDPDSIPGFKVSVYSSTATPTSEFELPQWSDFIPLSEVTAKKAGGATLENILGGLDC